jgi:hypothetical protein
LKQDNIVVWDLQNLTFYVKLGNDRKRLSHLIIYKNNLYIVKGFDEKNALKCKIYNIWPCEININSYNYIHKMPTKFANGYSHYTPFWTRILALYNIRHGRILPFYKGIIIRIFCRKKFYKKGILR